jgi:hypothetical protein
MSMGRKVKVCLAEEEDDGAQTVQVRVPDLGFFLLSTTPFLMQRADERQVCRLLRRSRGPEYYQRIYLKECERW